MPTLRTMISQLTSSTDKRELFQGVNRQWNDPSKYILTYRKQVRNEARSRVTTLLTYLQNTTGYELCSRYFSDTAIEDAKQQIWDEALHDVIQSADLMVPMEAINADAEYLGIQQTSNEKKTETPTDQHAINVYLEQAANSVKTFNSNSASVASLATTNKDDQSTSTLHTPLAKNDQISPQDFKQLTSTLLNIQKTISVLDANVKNSNQESEEILGKLIVLETFMHNNPSSNKAHHETHPGDITSIPGSDK